MGRFENFKETRLIKLKFFLGFSLFFILIIFGIVTTDYSINCVVSDTPKIGIIQVAEVSKDLYSIDFANRRYKLNTYYLSRDIEKLKRRFLK